MYKALAYGHNLKTSAILSATLRFGGALGALLSGLITNYIARYSIVVKYYSTGSLLLASFLIYGPVFPVLIVFLIFAFFGFFLGGSSLGFPLVGQYTPPALRGIGFGIMAAMGYLLCAFLQYVIGLILATSTSANVYDFKIALTPLVAILVIGWVCTLFLQDVKSSLDT